MPGMGTHEMGLCFIKLENPCITPGEEKDEDERPAKAGSWGFYKVLQGWSLGFGLRDELLATQEA